MGRMVEQESVLTSQTRRERSPGSRPSGLTGRGRARAPFGLRAATSVLLTLWLLAAAAPACDDSVRIPNALPSVAGVDTIECTDGICDVWLRVVDPDLDGVDLLIECLLDGEETCAIEDAPGTDGRFGLVPERTLPGRSHLLRLVPQLDDEAASLRLRFTPTDMQGDEGEAFTTPAFTMAEGLP